MATSRRKMVQKEVGLWKKRISQSKRNMASAYKDFTREARKVYRDLTK